MSDVSYMMGAAGIVQHVQAGWSSFSSVVAMAKQIPLITTQRYGFNRLDDFAGKGGSPHELMKCDQVETFFSALNLTTHLLHERHKYVEQTEAIDEILKRKPNLSHSPTDHSLRYSALIARRKELGDYLTGVNPIKPSLRGYA